MGNSKSKSESVSTNENNQTIVNKNTMDLLNEQVNEVIAKTKIDNSASCRGSINQAQALSLAGCTVGGDLNINNINFKQNAEVVDFKCLQNSNVDNEMAQEILTGIMGEIQSTLDNQSLNRMTTAAETSAIADPSLFGNSTASSSSESTNKFNLQVTNDNTTSIQNIVKNAINTEFNVKDVQECVAEIAQKQEIDVSNCDVGGNLSVSDVFYDQSAQLLAECIQNKGISQKIVNSASTDLGVIIESETASKAEVDQEATATATSESGGSLFDMLGGSFGGCGNMLGTSCGSCGNLLGVESELLGWCYCVCLTTLCFLSTLGAIYGLAMDPGVMGDDGGAILAMVFCFACLCCISSLVASSGCGNELFGSN